MPFIGTMDFKKVDFTPNTRIPLKQNLIRAKNKQVTFSLDMTQQLNWKKGDRIDLLQSGLIFAFEKTPTGVFELVTSNKGAKTLLIRSTNLDRHLRTAVGLDECVVFTAHVDGERIVFYKGEH